MKVLLILFLFTLLISCKSVSKVTIKPIDKTEKVREVNQSIKYIKKKLNSKKSQIC